MKPVQGLGHSWTPKVCRIMALTAIIMGLGLLFHILLGFRFVLEPQSAAPHCGLLAIDDQRVAIDLDGSIVLAVDGVVPGIIISL